MSKMIIRLIVAFGILVLLAGCFKGEQSSKEVILRKMQKQ